MRLVWIFFSYVIFALGLPILLFHPKLRDGFFARLGFVKVPKRQTHVSRIWVHGASAGDVQALLATVRALKTLQPDIEIIASTITNSGRAMAEKMHTYFSAVTYLPYDLPSATKRSLKAIQPDLLILEYTELWPNLLYAARDLGIPVVLHNGRIAQTNVNRYRLLFRFTGNLLRKLSLLLMRNPSEAERAIALGADTTHVEITGDTKFDNLGVIGNAEQIELLRKLTGFSVDDLIFVAGSTHEGEEDILLDTFVALRQNYPTLKLVLTPRYLNRIDKIIYLIEKYHLRFQRRSELPTENTYDVLIIDSIGELAACYALASVVFVGGSLIPHGGHNILEPASCGKPVLFGPHMENFREPVQLLLGHGGIQIIHKAQLYQVLSDLLGNAAYRQELGQLAQQKVRTVSGAAMRNAQQITALLRKNS